MDYGWAETRRLAPPLVGAVDQQGRLNHSGRISTRGRWPVLGEEIVAEGEVAGGREKALGVVICLI